LKLLLALFALMLAIGFATLWFWRQAPEPAPCDSRDVAQIPSPQGRVQADVFVVDCGGILATHVALRPAGAAIGARGDIFIARGSVSVRPIWNGERELVVESPAERRLVEETRWRNVAVRIRRAP
jgi:hypothetical protein